MNIYKAADGEQIKKYHVALFVKKASGTYTQISKSTDNTITMNAETVDRDFIVDKSPTTLVDRYKPSLSEPITLFKGDADYEFFWDLFYNQKAGSDAQGKILVVFLNEDTTDSDSNTVYKAWETDCSFVCDNLNPVESTLTFNINMNGTTALGTVAIDNTSDPATVTFTEAA